MGFKIGVIAILILGQDKVKPSRVDVVLDSLGTPNEQALESFVEGRSCL